MSAAREVDVEQQLRLAAATAAWPATPDLRAGVLARIAAGGAARAGSVVAAPVPDRRPAWLRPLAAVALAVLALLAAVGVAAGLGFHLPGFDIVIVERLPSAAAVAGSIAPTGSRSAGAPPTAGAQRNLGSPIPVSDAVVLDRPRVLVPDSMPTPDAAFVIGAGDRRLVTLAWLAEPGQARLPSSDLALTVMAVPGDIDDSLIKKIATPDTSVALVSVNGDRGWWISGAPHELLIVQPDGQIGSFPAAIAGDTLVFARDGTLYRLESSLGRDATVAIAEGLR